MYIIGITGGIACGKSTVSNEISKYGARIINADSMIHWLMTPNEEIFNAYVNHFGKNILNEEGLIDRKKVASIVFNDETQLKWINDTTHPILLKHVRERLVKYQKIGTPLVVLDVPLLFEAGWNKYCDEVWVIYLNPEKQIQRLINRNNMTEEEATSRIKAQLNNDEKIRKADVVIDNSLSIKFTRKKIKNLIQNRFPHLVKSYEDNKKFKSFYLAMERFMKIEKNSLDSFDVNYSLDTESIG